MLPEQDDFLEKLFREHFNELELYAYALLKDQPDAREAVQDAFHIACTKIEAVMESPNPMGWMRLTVKNLARNRRRQRSREMLLLLPLEEAGETPAQEEEGWFEFLEQCRAVLTPEEMELLMSVVVEGAPYSEKASDLGISVWACYKRVKRSLEKLRHGLER